MSPGQHPRVPLAVTPCTPVTRRVPILELELGRMRLKLPLLRARYIPPARAPILRYGVAVLSITLALIPALMLSDVVESRLVVFAVAIMVSAQPEVTV